MLAVNPVRMAELLKDLLSLAGIHTKKDPDIVMLTVRDDIIEELKIETFTSFIEYYPLAQGYCIEVEEPTITGVSGGKFKISHLYIILRRSKNDEWSLRIYTEKEEIPHGFIKKLKEKLGRRGEDLLKVLTLLWKIIRVSIDIYQARYRPPPRV